MNERDSLGDRMKLYEGAFSATLPIRTPVIVRLDGKAFHTWTQGFERPFSEVFMDYMDQAALAVCVEAQDTQMAYVQSDEISVLLHNYKTFKTQAWFDNQIQKVVSVSAACAAATVTLAARRVAMFDARVFVLPEAEVTNYFFWRQNDWSRNSLSMLARSVYSDEEMFGKKQAEIHEMLYAKGLNWNDLPTRKKRGRCVIRGDDGQWGIDDEIPIWKGEGRDYVERLLAVEEEGAT